jgi:hypothetical protein
MLSRVALLLSGGRFCVGWQTEGYPWFDQFKAEEYYAMPNGKTHQLPLRLHSHETVLTGTADLETVKADFAEEYYTPVSVGGKASVQIWMNNFTDTDCGNADTKNPYLETWTSTWVTPKDQPLELPYNNDMSLLIADPKAKIWIHRVILGDAPGIDTKVNDPALGALLGGHGVWGFPKHKVKAEIDYTYQGSDKVRFHAKHLGSVVPGVHVGPKTMVDALTVSLQLPEKSKGNIAIPTNVRTADDAVVGGPLFMVQQVLFGEAFNTTQNIAPWNAETDTIAFGHDDYYTSVLKSWNFEPKLKMHTDDFQIAAFKPINWQGKLSSTSALNNSDSTCAKPGDCGRAYQACCVGMQAKGFPCGCHLKDGTGKSAADCGTCGSAYSVCCAGFKAKGYPCTCDISDGGSVVV